MLTKKEIKALIPRGKISEVAKRAGVEPVAVYAFFRIESRQSFEIQKAALEVAIECQQKINPLVNELTGMQIK